MTAPLTAFDNDGLRFRVHDWGPADSRSGTPHRSAAGP